jgi:hypothetical protein
MVIIQAVRLSVQNVSKRKRNNFLMLFLFLGGAFFFFSCHTTTSPLADEEQQDLESFFRMLFTQSEFAYTLLGDKPLSFYSYFYRQPKACLILAKFFEPKLEHHYTTYQKYKHLFSTNNFLLLDQPCLSNKFPTAGYARDILIINKQAFITTVDKHENLFSKRLATPVTGKSLLSEIEGNKNVLFEVLQEDELLWGILLGYGGHNASLYARQEEIRTHRSVMASSGFENTQDEMAFIDDHLTTFSDDYNLYLIPLPKFGFDDQNGDTSVLINKYRETQKRICEVYCSPNFLTLVLKQLTTNRVLLEEQHPIGDP